MRSTSISYFLESAAKLVKRERLACPNCGSRADEVIDRKYLVTYLARCGGCRLQFRAPTTSEEELRGYYQRQYSQGYTTDLPSDEVLAALMSRGFKGTERDYSPYIEVLRALGCGEGDRLLDFGCSWGYGSWQFREAGFAVQAFELSESRGAFAKEKLGLPVFSDPRSIPGPYDVFFSAHVLEHIPKVSEVIALARRVVRPGGLFVAVTPNGSATYRVSDPSGWHTSWGFVHPLMLDDVFYKSAFAQSRHLIDTVPYDTAAMEDWARSERLPLTIKLTGNELIFAVTL